MMSSAEAPDLVNTIPLACAEPQLGLPMPPEAPLAMPTQGLLRYDPPRARVRSGVDAATWLARLLIFGGGVALTVYGAMEMYGVVSVGGVTLLEWALLVLFVANFSWIALAFSGALYGFVWMLFFAPKPRRRIDWLIVSEGTDTASLAPIIDVLRVNGARSITTQLNGASSDVVRSLADSDLLFVSPSFLSFSAGVLNPLCIKVGSDRLQFARFHGMRRFVGATLTRAHTDRADSEYYQITRESDIHQTFAVSPTATANFLRMIQDAFQRRKRGRTLADQQAVASRTDEDADAQSRRLIRQSSFVREVVVAATETADMFNAIPTRTR